MSSALETLRRDFGGGIIKPGGAEYEPARRTILASGSPAHVLRPGSVTDVQAGVRFAASAGLALAVRGGGHGFPGFGTNDGGVVIDLSRLAHVTIIDSERHLVRIGGGATWGQVAAALTPHGLAISSGDTKSVGVGGLTLTGGIGWKVRKYGLALDNVAAVRASERSPFIAVRSLGGAVARVPDDSTAYAHRQAELMIVTTSAGPKPVVEAARPALEAIWVRLAPHVSGAYANFLSTATATDVAAIYPSEVYSRLAAVKRQYDPGNLFAGNHNIRPHEPVARKP